MDPLPRLGALETAVLRHLWARGAAEARAVHASLPEARDITLSTVQSTLERLHRKGLLLREKVGHAFRYAPAVSREQFQARAIADAAGDLRGPAAEGVLAALVDVVARVDRANLDRLARALAAARAGAGRRSA